MRHARWTAVTISALLMMIAPGCGDQRPSVESSTAEGTVKGKVTIKGKPASKGSVVFDPANYLRKDATARTASINPDGTYTVTTLVGGNMIRVSSPEAEAAGASYMSIDFDVKAGDNTLDITLPRE
jgi:hypothetical protein